MWEDRCSPTIWTGPQVFPERANVMPLTLREAMTLVEPLRKSKVLAGEQGLDNVLQSVNVMEVPDILEWVHPGELLVTTMYPLRDNEAALETLVPRLAEKRLAGLAVTPSDYLNVLPQCMVESADRLGFPLLELPEKVSFIDIIQPITNVILKLQADELRESERIHKQFIQLVLGGGSYGDIAQEIAQRLERPVFIVDRFRRVLGEGQVIGKSQSYRVLTRDEQGGDRYLGRNYQPEVIEKLPGSGAVRKVVSGPDGVIEHVAYPVMVGPMPLGEIIVWGPMEKPHQSIELIAIEHGSTVAALKMMERRAIAEVEERFRNEILEGLLSVEPAERDSAIRLSTDLGHRLVSPFAVIVVAPDFPSDTPLTKVKSIEQRNIGSSLYLARRYIRAIEPNASFWYQGPRLVVFFPFWRRAASDARDLLTRELRFICDRIKGENEPYSVSMGVSTIAHDLEDFRFAHDCAKQSLELGPTLQDSNIALVTHYDELGLFRVVSSGKNAAGLDQFCQDTIGPLLEHDSANRADLLRTLRVYLEQNQNSARAAKLLFIHYNTLRHRIKRVKEILGNDLENPQRRMAIEVALQIYPLVSRYGRTTR